MNIFKIKQGISQIKMITRENFMDSTHGKAPFFEKGQKSQFAVCPHCDNPIQIVGLFRDETITPERKPYGKHYPYSVPKLAEYSKLAYETCPYANPNRKLTHKSIKKSEDSVSGQIMQNVINNFDRIVTLLEDDFEIYLSLNILTKMLTAYRMNEGNRYIGATLANYPWTFAYMTFRTSVFGMGVRPNTGLYKALVKDKDVNMENGRIEGKVNQFLHIAYFNMNHQVAPINGDEFMDYYIFIKDKENNKQSVHGDRTVYKKHIVFDYDKYERIKTKLSGNNRKQNLLDLAKEILGGN